MFPVYIIAEIFSSRRSHRHLHDPPAERQTLRHVRPRETTCDYFLYLLTFDESFRGKEISREEQGESVAVLGFSLGGGHWGGDTFIWGGTQLILLR